MGVEYLRDLSQSEHSTCKLIQIYNVSDGVVLWSPAFPQPHVCSPEYSVQVFGDYLSYLLCLRSLVNLSKFNKCMFLCILSSPTSLAYGFVATQLVLVVWVVTIFSCDFLWPKQIWKSQCNFWWKDLFDFIVVHLSNFSLYCVSFCGIFEKSLSIPGLQRYLPLFSSKSFIVFWQFNEIWILL